MWIAITQNPDGSRQEHPGDSTDWASVRNRLIGLAFVWNGKRHDLPTGMRRYFQACTASMRSDNGKICVESRYIGCEDRNGRTMRFRFREGNLEPIVEIETKCPTPST